MSSIWNFSTGLQCFCIALTEWFSQIQSVWSYRRFWLLPSGPTWHLNIRRFSCTNFYNTRLYKKSCSLSIHSPMIILTICETLQMIWAVINHFGGCQLVHFYLTTRLLHFGILVLSIQSNPRCYIHLRWCFFIITWHVWVYAWTFCNIWEKIFEFANFCLTTRFLVWCHYFPSWPFAIVIPPTLHPSFPLFNSSSSSLSSSSSSSSSSSPSPGLSVPAPSECGGRHSRGCQEASLSLRPLLGLSWSSPSPSSPSPSSPSSSSNQWSTLSLFSWLVDDEIPISRLFF